MYRVVITAKTGPAKQVTGDILNDVHDIHFDVRKQVLTIFQTAQAPREFDFSSIATVTFTSSGELYTLTISE
jgi:hypothetical protein